MVCFRVHETENFTGSHNSEKNTFSLVMEKVILTAEPTLILKAPRPKRNSSSQNL